MKKSRSIVLAAVVMVGASGLTLWSADETGKTIGETCLSLAASVARSPGTDPGKVDYNAFASLKVPPLSPDAALATFKLDEGFRIEVVAHEPMVMDPVAMDIDADGRLWVVELQSYMPVHDLGDWETAVREQVPKGRIVVLEDTNGDGTMDTQRVFREGLILPRAIKVLRDGVLVGESPNVWFIRDTTGDGKGDTRELVTRNYGDPNLLNVEGMPNGLMWGMDNWIHSARDSTESLRRVDGRWQSRPFEALGQWGITQDNWGRLYSANNSWPLEANLVPYGYSQRHPLFSVSTGISARIAPNGPVWPAIPTGVNRGYKPGYELRENGTLQQDTSTTGVVIYRGGQFGDEYVGNAFTPEPAANLIHRILIDGDPGDIEAKARFAYKDREFLTSTDERFRPVNMYNAPDGSLYVVDMYRGLIQHARYLTDYLRTYAVDRDLHKPVGGFGRIYRIVRTDRPIAYRTPRLSTLRPQDLVDQLRQKNGRLRDQAQELLVQCSPADVVPSLEGLARDRAAESYTRLHALWTLEGLNRSTYGQDRLTRLALQALGDEHPRVRSAALRILEPAIARGARDVLRRLAQMTGNESSPYVRLQLLASLGAATNESTLPLIARILTENVSSPYFREMALTGVYHREAQLARILRSRYGWREAMGEEHTAVLASLAEGATRRPRADLGHLTAAQRTLFESGRQKYAACATCHGADGKGMSGVGPPLAGSTWVVGDPRAVVRIALQGFSGGAAERKENIAGVMPGHAFLSDEDVAAILTYIRQSWRNQAPPVAPEDIRRIREETIDRRDTWSPDELREVVR